MWFRKEKKEIPEITIFWHDRFIIDVSVMYKEGFLEVYKSENDLGLQVDCAGSKVYVYQKIKNDCRLLIAIVNTYSYVSITYNNDNI